MGSELLTQEIQHWRSRWSGALLLFAGVSLVSSFCFVMYKQLILGTPVGSRPAPDWVLLILGVVMVTLGFGLIFLALGGKLITEVRSDALYVQHYPLTRRHRFAYAEIAGCAARKYNALTEYGGYGVRRGLFGKGKAYNVAGSWGVQLEMTNGKKMLIGSQRAEQIARAIQDRITEAARATVDQPLT